ncbi:MAG: hypothetical protein WBW53_09400 [Terriglobales bacterium]
MTQRLLATIAALTFAAEDAGTAEESDGQFDFHLIQQIIIRAVNAMATMKSTVSAVRIANQAWFPTKRGGLFQK